MFPVISKVWDQKTNKNSARITQILCPIISAKHMTILNHYLILNHYNHLALFSIALIHSSDGRTDRHHATLNIIFLKTPNYLLLCFY